MILIRPKTIDVAALSVSDVYETVPAAWASGTTYAEGDQVAVLPQATIVNHLNTTVTSLGGGLWRIAKSGGLSGGVYNADAVSSEAFTGDFTVRCQVLQTNKSLFVGVNADPLTDGNPNGIDRAIQFRGDGVVFQWEGSSIGSSVAMSTSDYWFLRRVGTTVTALKGTSPDVSLASLQFTFTALSGTVYLDSAFDEVGGAVDVLASYVSAGAAPIPLYRSLQAGNIANDPTSSPTYWAVNGYAYPVWSSSTIYALGDTITDTTAHRLYESLSGGTSAIVTMTIAGPCVVTWTAHGLAANAPIVFQTTGALPTGLTAGTVYYVLVTGANTFNVAATSGGAAINTSGSQSGVHTAIANPNLNMAITEAAFWLDIGPSNRWAMFDNYNGTVTSNIGSIDVSLAVTGRADSLALVNLARASEVQVIVTDATLGIVYDVTTPLVSTDGITDWYAWFYEEPEQKSVFWAVDLPPYSNPTIRVILSGTSSDPITCGSLVVGLAKSLGRTLHDGAQIGITDFSRKDVDAFGNYTLVERPFSNRATFRMWLYKGEVDGVFKTLAQYRATPAVFIATDDYESTLVFGFYRDFNIEIPQPNTSYCSLELEGLT